MSRKGELSSTAVDRGSPYQVALPASLVSGQNHGIIEAVKRELGGCPRGHAVVRDDSWFVIFCFADQASADIFCERFNGEPFDPKNRGRGSMWMIWRKR
jgi:hypothetical protein